MFWFNGAISANLIRGRWKGAQGQVLAADTNVVFRVGVSGEMFGKDAAAAIRGLDLRRGISRSSPRGLLA